MLKQNEYKTPVEISKNTSLERCSLQRITTNNLYKQPSANNKMKIHDIAKTLLLTAALALSPSAQSSINISQPAHYENSVDQTVESIEFNTKKGIYEISAKINGETITEGFYEYELGLIKAGIENESERNAYLEKMHRIAIPIIAEDKFKSAMHNLESWQGLRKLESVLGKQDTQTVLPYIIIESGGDLGIKRTRGHCYGLLQVKYPVFQDTRYYCQRHPESKLAKDVRKIQWEDLKKRLVAPQAIIFLGYQDRIDEMYDIYTENRLNGSDRQNFRDLGWNLGPVVVGKTIKQIHGPGIRYNEAKFQITSPVNLRKFSSYKGFSETELIQKKAIALSYPEFCNEYRRLIESEKKDTKPTAKAN